MPRGPSNRLSVLATLRGADRPMTAYENLDAVRADGIRAPTMVYRALNQLIGEGLVHRIETLGAYVACHDECRGERPFFIICDDCGRVEEFSEERVLSDLAMKASRNGFELCGATVELHGRCGACSADDARAREKRSENVTPARSEQGAP